MDGDKKSIWTRLGIGALRLADAGLINGAGTILFETGQSILEDHQRDRVEGLDWELEYHRHYPAEMPHLLRVDDSAAAPALPQVPLFLPGSSFDPKAVRLELQSDDFRAEFVVADVINAYRTVARQRGKTFFDGKNARLLHADDERFVFQGSSYFDYLGTNLALEVEQPPFGTRRRQISPLGALEPLTKSVLANATGANGLMFTSDGHMVLQRRSDKVIVRPSQICPGFSGTIDKEDIESALGRGGSLADLRSAREMVEETGATYGEIKTVKFLGITRELIRGGAPEMFFAVDLNIPHTSLIDRDCMDGHEGELLFIDLGLYGRAAGIPKSSSMTLGKLLDSLADAVPGKHSLPLITNLVLWHRARTA